MATRGAVAFRNAVLGLLVLLAPCVAVNRYVAFYLEHMRIEETELLPLAEAALGADDWAALDAAFIANRDPLSGHEADEVYRPLFRKILRLLPGSSSVGAALEALAGSGPPKYRWPP